MPADDLSALAATLRHDLRTPLNQIIGYAELLEEDASEEVRADLGRIHGAARNMLAMVDHGIDQLVQAAGAEPARIARSDDGVAAAALPEAKPADESVAVGSGHILVVDDNEINTDMLARRLARRGFTVDVAADGHKALEMIAERKYDCVLLDIMMPGISGLDVLRTIRQRHAHVDLPVIMATAREGNDDVVEALKLGANDYVKKPIDLPVLLARVDAHLLVKRLAEQLSVRNRFIQSVFGRYMSDQIVDRLLGTPDALTMGGEQRTVTILMSDLRGFSALSERLTPTEVIALLNAYLAEMTEIIYRHGGTIDEFIGDAILVLFGAPLAGPDDALRAVTCAVEMQRAIKTINARNVERGLPEVAMGVGINTGDVVVGNIGSERRAKYGVVGRNVNLASRIEAFTVGGQILLSDATLHAAGPTVALRRSMEVFPKGSKAPMVVHEVAGVGDLRLEDDAAPLHKLKRPALVAVVVLEGVHMREDPTPAHVVGLSTQQALLRTSTPLDVARLGTVRIMFDGVSASDTYGKVLDQTEDVLVHFTSVAPAAATKIEELLGDPT
jgi:adenylate cyclase